MKDAIINVSMIGNSYEDNKNTTRFRMKFQFWQHMSQFNQLLGQAFYSPGYFDWFGIIRQKCSQLETI